MKTRSVTHLLYAHSVDMGGMPVRQPFPTQNFERLDPFLLLHHANIKVPTNRDTRHAGVGPHPHRGFSPVTFIFKGGVHHRDSRGNNSIVYAGGAQWMNAGRGAIHSERPPHDIHDRGGMQEIIQLWINSPSKNKMDQPEYFAVQADDIPFVLSHDKLLRLNLVAGKLNGVTGPITTPTEINAATLEIGRAGKMDFVIPESHHAMIYLLDGKVNISGYGMAEGLNAVVFASDGEGISIEGVEETRALLLTGQPINEKVVAHGPFVMNNETQILEAMRDYQRGKMGVLIEE